MATKKLSISLPSSLHEFTQEYQSKHNLESTSEVILHALDLLREQELEAAYNSAARQAIPRMKSKPLMEIR